MPEKEFARVFHPWSLQIRDDAPEHYKRQFAEELFIIRSRFMPWCCLIGAVAAAIQAITAAKQTLRIVRGIVVSACIGGVGLTETCLCLLAHVQGAIVVASALVLLAGMFTRKSVCEKFLRSQHANLHATAVVACFYVVPVIYNIYPAPVTSPYHGTRLERL
jgi:hypothetical protein